MDNEHLKTHVYVHSPLIECSSKGGYYTSYAIHLMSNNPCFTHKTSHNRRRYSEFVQLRQMLTAHHPTIVPPVLPPKKFFNKFSNDFIEERMKGLQKFLKEVLAVSVYLSDKSLHMFLQSSSSMSKINEECLGEIPAPPLITPSEHMTSHSDTCSSRSSEYLEAQLCARSLQSLVLDDVQIGVQSQISVPRTSEEINTLPKSSLISALRKCDSKPFAIPKRNGSLESTPSSSPSSSLDTSYSSLSDRVKDRRVSFSDRVEIAIVTNYGISIIRP